MLRWEKLSVSHETSLEIGLEMSRVAALFPLCPLPHRQYGSTEKRFALPPYNLTGVRDQEIWPKSERELSDEKIANISDGEYKALVIKMLTELIELG